MYNYLPVGGSFYSADSLVGHYPTLQEERLPQAFPDSSPGMTRGIFIISQKTSAGTNPDRGTVQLVTAPKIHHRCVLII